MQYLYNDGEFYYFMNIETYDQIQLTEDQLGDALKYIKENMNVTTLTYKDKIFAVEPPLFVELEVTYTEPGFSGKHIIKYNKTSNSRNRDTSKCTIVC